MANEALLSRVPIAAGAVHRMMTEKPPEEAAIEYGRLLKANFGDGGLELVMLGMGDDGHTASLFPYSAALGETHHRCVANWVEKMSTWRVTMSAPFINRAKMVMILVSGAGKADRLAEVIDGPRDEQRLPIQLINPAGEGAKLVWMVDEAAAVKLKTRG
jgi:6-phosphogluconolactonase